MYQMLYQWIRSTYWKLPFSYESKETFIANVRIISRKLWKNMQKEQIHPECVNDIQAKYIKQILEIPNKCNTVFKELPATAYIRDCKDPKVIAYYLPQFHPTEENDKWWGKGVTEWNNVARSVPQYLGHYQPRLPGELGFYDLRISENIERQVELAKQSGIFGFAMYFYWFDGKRLLDKPLDMFVNNPSLDFPFCLCWANESWTRRFDGSCGEILIKQSETIESYNAFIDSVIPYMRNPRYITVANKPVLIVYRPSFVPDCKATLEKWRRKCVTEGIGDIYIIGVKEHTWDRDLLDFGFDAQSEFHPGTLFKHCQDITNQMSYVSDNFGGQVFDYSDIVLAQKYFKYNHPKLYRAVMPMWDNTARRNNKGMIFEGATPELYGRWLMDVFNETINRKDIEETFVFINAWNEWGEGAYLEPDRRYGYAYLNATREAIESCRK